MTYRTEGTSHFLNSGMTPRAWRMIAYCLIGFCVYGLVLLTEAAQNFQLNRMDQQLQNVYDQELSGENKTPDAVTALSEVKPEQTP